MYSRGNGSFGSTVTLKGACSPDKMIGFFFFFFQPRNIFLHGLRHRKEDRQTSYQVKIGDFGLARKEVVVSPDGGSPLASLIEPLTPLFLPGIVSRNGLLFRPSIATQ